MTEEFKQLSHAECMALSENDRQRYYQEADIIRTRKNFALFMDECKKEGVDTSKWKIYTGGIAEVFDDMVEERDLD